MLLQLVRPLPRQPGTLLRLLAAPAAIGPGGIERKRAKGKDSESSASPSLLTVLSDWAAQRNNEVSVS